MSDNSDSEYSDSDSDSDVSSDDDDNYEDPIIFNDYEKLMNLTKQLRSDKKLYDIVYGLIKLVKLKKKKEISFMYDFNIAPKHEWIKIANEFNSNVCGRDYRILIDECSIVCYVVNDELIK